MAQTHSLDLERSSAQRAVITDASQTGLDITGDITIEAWIKPESALGTDELQFILSKSNIDNGNESYSFFLFNNSGTRQIYFQPCANGTAQENLFVSFTPLIGVWQHIAMTWDASAATATFYVNGKVIGTDTGALTSLFSGDASVMVGAFNSGTPTHHWDGLLKDVRVFSDIRTQDEIVADAHTENVTDANLEAEWNFNNDYTDSSGNGNDLTAVNSPVFATDYPWEGVSQASGSSLETNLVSWWSMDEASGDRADSHGGNDLTDNNTVGSAVGKQGNGADFESANSESLSISDGSQVGLDFTGDFTVAGWFKPESISSAAMIFMKGNNGASGTWYGLLMDATTGVLNAVIDNGTTAYLAAGNEAAVADTWIHVVVQRRGSVITIFTNGIQGALVTGFSSSLATANKFQFGVDEDSPNLYIDGILDEWAAWDTALDYGKILDLFAKGNGIPYSIETVNTYRGFFNMVEKA